MTTAAWVPYHEPLRATLTRTVTIALVAGFVVARSWGGLAVWPQATLVMLWPSFGGHWVDIWFLNWLRPRISAARGVQVGARLVAWFIGGAVFIVGMGVTAAALGFKARQWPPWWIGGLAFIAVEFVAHLALQVRGRPSFYNGRG